MSYANDLLKASLPHGALDLGGANSPSLQTSSRVNPHRKMDPALTRMEGGAFKSGGLAFINEGLANTIIVAVTRGP